MSARAGDLTLKSPQERRARPAPALEIGGSTVIDPTQGPTADQAIRQRQCRHSSIHVPNECLALGSSCRRGHRFRAFEGGCHRLLTGDVLPSLECGDRLFGVDIIGGGDVDEVDGRIRCRSAPVGGPGRPTPGGREGLEILGVAGGHCVQGGCTRLRKELANTHPGVRMGSSHELGAQQCDVGDCHGRFSSRPFPGYASTPRYWRCNLGSFLSSSAPNSASIRPDTIASCRSAIAVAA